MVCAPAGASPSHDKFRHSYCAARQSAAWTSARTSAAQLAGHHTQDGLQLQLHRTHNGLQLQLRCYRVHGCSYLHTNEGSVPGGVSHILFHRPSSELPSEANSPQNPSAITSSSLDELP